MYSGDRSGWVKINGADSAAIKASLTTDNSTFKCMGTVMAKRGCWSFLKGGFVLDSSLTSALIYFQVYFPKYIYIIYIYIFLNANWLRKNLHFLCFFAEFRFGTY